jgi:hypothetical protein
MSDKNFRANRARRNLTYRERVEQTKAREDAKKAAAARVIDAALEKLRGLFKEQPVFRQKVRDRLSSVPEFADPQYRVYAVLAEGYDWTIRHKGWSGRPPQKWTTPARMARFIVERFDSGK